MDPPKTTGWAQGTKPTNHPRIGSTLPGRGGNALAPKHARKRMARESSRTKRVPRKRSGARNRNREPARKRATARIRRSHHHPTRTSPRSRILRGSAAKRLKNALRSCCVGRRFLSIHNALAHNVYFAFFHIFMEHIQTIAHFNTRFARNRKAAFRACRRLLHG